MQGSTWSSTVATLTTLIHPDAEVRRTNIADLTAALRIAGAANCLAVITGAGSHNPGGAWWPHADNYSPQTFDQLVASLRQAVKVAEDEGVLLGLEGSTLTPLRNAQTTARRARSGRLARAPSTP